MCESTRRVTYDHEIATLRSSEVMIAHETTVLDLRKGHPHAGIAGSSMAILQGGGIIARPDGYIAIGQT
jgi:hypothetical protein